MPDSVPGPRFKRAIDVAIGLPLHARHIIFQRSWGSATLARDRLSRSPFPLVMSKEGLTRNPPARLAASREDG